MQHANMPIPNETQTFKTFVAAMPLNHFCFVSGRCQGLLMILTNA